MLKGKLSEVKRRTYSTWKWALAKYKKGTYENEKEALLIKENVHS